MSVAARSNNPNQWEEAVMKFARIGHFDDFGDECVIWGELSDLPQNIQEWARAIDGDNYIEDGFGVCLDYDKATGEFRILTEESGNIFYVDVDGDKIWNFVEMPEAFIADMYEICKKELRRPGN